MNLYIFANKNQKLHSRYEIDDENAINLAQTFFIIEYIITNSENYDLFMIKNQEVPAYSHNMEIWKKKTLYGTKSVNKLNGQIN